MLTVETKRHIDSARQILVGKVPDPKAQIEQITNALIYKFMDDMDIQSRDAGGKPSFFTGELEQYAWSKLMDPRKGAQERLDMYVRALDKFSAAASLPSLFRDIFRQAFLPYRDPETLNLFLKEIEYFDYNHSEELGNAFEYLLSIMGSQGDAGQFRTPRHIIDFIVDVVDPGKDDTILDPACGTAGFLISAYKHILEQHDGVDEQGSKNNEVALTHQQKQKLLENMEGYDISSDMVKLARVNMYLHDCRTPKIFEYDTLTSEERWGDNFDVILANPPFMSPKGGIRPHNKFGVESSRAEVLFVDYIMSHLKQNGRAGIIVPEGVIFQSGKAYKQLRKNLVEDGLMAVVSLPSGVFNPYAGVKTSILIFDNNRSKKSDQLVFAKVAHDGFDLGAQRRPTPNKNDLPVIARVLRKYRLGELNTQAQLDEYLESEAALREIGSFNEANDIKLVDRAKVAETGDYNLSASRYLEEKSYQNQKWPIIELSEITDYIRGLVYSKTDEVSTDGLKVLRANNIEVSSSSLNLKDIKLVARTVKVKENQRLIKGDILICAASGSKEHVGKVAYIDNDTEMYFGGFMAVIRTNEVLLSRYLYYQLKAARFNEFLRSQISGANINNLKASILGRFTIPLPPIEMQKEIVAELDGYQKNIEFKKVEIVNEEQKIKDKIAEIWGE